MRVPNWPFEPQTSCHTYWTLVLARPLTAGPDAALPVAGSPRRRSASLAVAALLLTAFDLVDRALYAEAPSFDETDWPQIVALYDKLLAVWPSPVVELNRAVALAMAAGPETALAEIGQLERDGRLSGYQYLPAIKAGLLSRPGRTGQSAAYRQALALTASQAERALLAGQIADHTLPA